MTRRTPRNQPLARPWTVALVLVAIAAGVALGLALNRPVGPQPALPETPAVPTATATATRVRIESGGRLNLEIETPLPGMTPPAEPRLTTRLDIRDTETEQPVRGDVWLLVDGQEQLVAKNVSIVEFPLPGKQGLATIKVQVEGYQLWALTFNYQAKYDRLLPLPVRMERLKPETGSGA